MAYIGSTPTTQSFIAGTDSFNGTGSATNFTLSRFVNSVNDIQVVVNNVVQYPPNYSVSGNTLTISPAPSSGTNNVYVRYLSTTLQSITVPGGTTVNGSWGINGDLNFYGNARRITGDFSNATVANRVMFQTSTVNGATRVEAIPNGTGTTANFAAYNNSDPTNAAAARLTATASETRVESTITGTGTYLPMTFYTGGSERMRIDTSGNVGIGTSSPSKKLDVFNSGTTTTDFIVRNGTVSLLSFVDSGAGYTGTSTNHPLLFTTNGSERARIDTSGYMWIKSTGGTSPWDATSGTYAKFGDIYPIGATAQSNIVAIFNRNTTTGAAIELKYNGAVVGSISVTTTATAYNTSSDYRLKHDIAPMTGALAKVQALKPCTYKWNVDDSDGEGFIAHELAEVVPQCVTGEKDAVDADGNPQYQGIDTSFLVATLTAAIQELKAELDATKAEVAALKGAA